MCKVKWTHIHAPRPFWPVPTENWDHRSRHPCQIGYLPDWPLRPYENWISSRFYPPFEGKAETFYTPCCTFLKDNTGPNRLIHILRSPRNIRLYFYTPVIRYCSSVSPSAFVSGYILYCFSGAILISRGQVDTEVMMCHDSHSSISRLPLHPTHHFSYI